MSRKRDKKMIVKIAKMRRDSWNPDIKNWKIEWKGLKWWRGI
jgi:hypothetical protein